MPVQSAILFETIEEIYGRVFRELRPSLDAPGVTVKFHRFTNLTSNIRLLQGQLVVKISDLLEEAPPHVQESLAYILLSKLFRQRPPQRMVDVYRQYLSRQDVQGRVQEMRQVRGRKLLTEPAGTHFDLELMFDRLNAQYFGGGLRRPLLGWSLQQSRTILGHYDAAHHAIALSRRLDRAEVPAYVVEYVLYHEMLHIKHPVVHKDGARQIHTKAFQQEEKLFESYEQAKAFLKKGWR